MTLALLSVLGGFALLWKGGDWLVDGADRFARSHGVPATLAGVFILGFGTSVPELAVSIIAMLDGKPGIAVGNVVGSNIANVGLILGITALLLAIPVNRFLLRIEMPFCVLASALALYLGWDGHITRQDGMILLGAFALYALYAVLTAGRRQEADPSETAPPTRNTAKDLGLALLGLVAVIGGARLFNDGAQFLAAEFGLSDGVVGKTLVALGTSLPELATALAAVRARQPDLALGNIIGSNIFNVLLVLGVAGVGVDQVLEPGMRSVDFPVVVGVALLPWVLGMVFGRIPRWMGLPMVAGYATYVAFSAGLLG